MKQTDRVKKHTPGLYSYVPGDVTYDKHLNDAAVRVYNAISGLCGRNGCCYASNEWFARSLGKNKWTISRIITRLQRFGHIICVISQDEGNKRYMMCFNEKQLRILAKASTVNGSKSTGELLSNIAIGLLSQTTTPIVINDNTPIAENHNHRIREREQEGEEPPPPAFRKGSKEEICWTNYLTARDRVEHLFGNEFFKFFEDEVMGRFNKQDVTATTLSDWHIDIWVKHDPADVIKLLKEQRAETGGWQVKWQKLVKDLKKIETDKVKKSEKEEFTARQAMIKRKEQAKMRERVEQIKRDNIELAGIDPEAFILKYKSSFYKKQFDSDPDLSKLTQELLEKEKTSAEEKKEKTA